MVKVKHKFLIETIFRQNVTVARERVGKQGERELSGECSCAWAVRWFLLGGDYCRCTCACISQMRVSYRIVSAGCTVWAPCAAVSQGLDLKLG